jgi:hypothetical protein
MSNELDFLKKFIGTSIGVLAFLVILFVLVGNAS